MKLKIKMPVNKKHVLLLTFLLGLFIVLRVQGFRPDNSVPKHIDFGVHLHRVLFLQRYGFTFWDPYVAAGYPIFRYSSVLPWALTASLASFYGTVLGFKVMQVFLVGLIYMFFFLFCRKYIKNNLSIMVALLFFAVIQRQTSFPHDVFSDFLMHRSFQFVFTLIFLYFFLDKKRFGVKQIILLGLLLAASFMSHNLQGIMLLKLVFIFLIARFFLSKKLIQGSTFLFGVFVVFFLVTGVVLVPMFLESGLMNMPFNEPYLRNCAKSLQASFQDNLRSQIQNLSLNLTLLSANAQTILFLFVLGFIFLNYKRMKELRTILIFIGFIVLANLLWSVGMTLAPEDIVTYLSVLIPLDSKIVYFFLPILLVASFNACKSNWKYIFALSILVAVIGNSFLQVDKMFLWRDFNVGSELESEISTIYSYLKDYERVALFPSLGFFSKLRNIYLGGPLNGCESYFSLVNNVSIINFHHAPSDPKFDVYTGKVQNPFISYTESFCDIEPNIANFSAKPFSLAGKVAYMMNISEFNNMVNAGNIQAVVLNPVYKPFVDFFFSNQEFKLVRQIKINATNIGNTYLIFEKVPKPSLLKCGSRGNYSIQDISPDITRISFDNVTKGDNCELSITYHPSLNMQIDGKPIAFSRTNYGFISFDAPAGDGVIELSLGHSYEKILAWVSLISLAILLFILFRTQSEK